MKITISQLRRIIKEEVGLRARRRLTEGPGDVAKAELALSGALRDAWIGAYDDTDPSMSATGPEDWKAQVEDAMFEFDDRLDTLISDVEKKLFGGM
jgi:hypothetical protein